MGSPGISDETKWLISRSAPLDGPCVAIAAWRRARDCEAEPVHAGVEMDRARADPAPTRGEAGPALKLLFAADRGREPMLDIVRRLGPALEAVEHIDLRLRRQRPPRRDPLIEMGDEEDPRPRGPQRGRSFGEADPVSIGLDDGGATPRRGAARELAPIVGERARSIVKTPGRSFGRDGVAHRKPVP